MTVPRRLVPWITIVAAVLGVVGGLRLYAFLAGG